jgi:RimJ/RimL family protein N-acetyltransferase
MELASPRGPIALRPVAAADAESFRQLRLEALQAHPEVYGSDYETQVQEPAEYWQQRVERTLGSGEEAMFVAEAAGQLIGMTGIFRDRGLKVRHSATIVSVYVRAEWRGNRITDGLIGLCLGWAGEHGVLRARIAVIASNASAIRCYVRCGFQVYGVEPAVILNNGVYHDELLMGRRV